MRISSDTTFRFRLIFLFYGCEIDNNSKKLGSLIDRNYTLMQGNMWDWKPIVTLLVAVIKKAFKRFLGKWNGSAPLRGYSWLMLEKSAKIKIPWDFWGDLRCGDAPIYNFVCQLLQILTRVKFNTIHFTDVIHFWIEKQSDWCKNFGAMSLAETEWALTTLMMTNTVGKKRVIHQTGSGQSMASRCPPNLSEKRILTCLKNSGIHDRLNNNFIYFSHFQYVSIY